MENVDRKKDHIDLAFASQIDMSDLDTRFYYEPLMKPHPNANSIPPSRFGKKTLKAPIWVSSMTGGTEMARTINQNLARACSQFGLGMGLGSCRPLLSGDEFLKDFDVRKLIGDEGILYANLGIAQIEDLLETNRHHIIVDVVNKLRADGIIIHVNPLQEWLQPEGDRINRAPIETIERLLDKVDAAIIVKEVGQGFGPQSLKALMSLPIVAIEFAAHGGTNFSKLELLRNDDKSCQNEQLSFQGHSAYEMVEMTNELISDSADYVCQNFIVSGGVKDYLTGYYLINKINAQAVYGQASTFLKYASESYELLEKFVEGQIKGLEMAYQYLRVRV